VYFDTKASLSSHSAVVPQAESGKQVAHATASSQRGIVNRPVAPSHPRSEKHGLARAHCSQRLPAAPTGVGEGVGDGVTGAGVALVVKIGASVVVDGSALSPKTPHAIFAVGEWTTTVCPTMSTGSYPSEYALTLINTLVKPAGLDV
jgi:hypothetical protein